MLTIPSWGVRRGGSLGFPGQSSIIAMFLANEKPFLKADVSPGLCMRVLIYVRTQIFKEMFDKAYI